jgi:hypothetical protein
LLLLVDRRFTLQVRETFRKIFGVPLDLPTHPLDAAPSFAMLFLQGLALDRIAYPDDDERSQLMLKALRRYARQTLAPR